MSLVLLVVVVVVAKDGDLLAKSTYVAARNALGSGSSGLVTFTCFKDEEFSFNLLFIV